LPNDRLAGIGGAHIWRPEGIRFPQRGRVSDGERSSSCHLQRRIEVEIRSHRSESRTRFSLFRSRFVEKLNKKKGRPAPRGELLAWNQVERRAACGTLRSPCRDGGVLATAGISCTGNRPWLAHRVSSPRRIKLWEFDAGNGHIAPPITYMVGGKQYLSVMVGWRWAVWACSTFLIWVTLSRALVGF
jgi:hypothetical protein